MPIYEYECQDCHKVAEILVSTSRAPQCPSCGGKKLEKLFSTFATSGGGATGHAHSAGCGHGGGGHCCGGHCHHRHAA